MKSFGALVLVAATLAGCQSLDHQRELAKNTPTDNLCLATVVGTKTQQQAAGEELATRNANCDWQRLQPLLQTLLAQQAARGAMLMQMAGQMSRQSQPYTLPNGTSSFSAHCVSTNTGYNVVTNCQ